jgi:enoyl-CoA hydratase/carnithine racemase
MSTRFVRCVIEDHVAIVTMDRPPVNALTLEVFAEMAKVFDELNDQGHIRVAILTGAGRVFCAGADLKSRGTEEPAPGVLLQYLRAGRDAMNAILECRVPVIGAVNGAALGGGLGIAASCDILLASDHAVFGLPEIVVGLLGGGRHLMRLVPHGKARRMILTGQPISASELQRLGTVENCVPNEQLMTTARELASAIASNSPVALRLTKHAMNTVEGMSLRDGLQFEHDLNNELSQSADAREAFRAFLEKRPPLFKGR